tara:strand:- start:432 stop:707 length:276 start_codon:yes stop_codon:yes gene_type:complete
MLPSLFKSDEVQESIDDYKKKSQYITNESTKQIVNKLIEELQQEIKTLDQAHRIRSAGELKPSLFSPNREKIHTIRQKIIQIYKENNIIRY